MAHSTEASLPRRFVAEGIGTALLVATIVGSGIMADRLAGGNTAVALLANVAATGVGLVALIAAFGPISGAHFNPVVTLADAWQRGMRWREAPIYIAGQILGGLLGVAAANAMFDLTAFTASQHVRTGASQWLGEAIATFGLMAVICGCARKRPEASPYAVGGYVMAAIWFTSSTSFANPAVTIARSLTDTFTGIRPADVPPFVAAQLVGGALATLLFRWLIPSLPSVADWVTVPHNYTEEQR